MTRRGPGRVLLALLVTAVAFGAGFAGWRALDDGDDAAPSAGSVQELPQRLVTINNLERAPSIKPLRSVAGAPEPTSPASAPAP